MTRVHPLVSEVTLLTDRDHAVPVQVVRNGLRAVAFGGGASGLLELRFMSAVADIQNGDQLVTSGIDGTYPAGIPVAEVVRIERDAEQTFARAFCRPVAGIDRGRYVLVLANDTNAFTADVLLARALARLAHRLRDAAASAARRARAREHERAPVDRDLARTLT